MRTSSYILHLPTLKGFDFFVCLFLKNLEIFRKCKQQETKPLLILPRDKHCMPNCPGFPDFLPVCSMYSLQKKKKTVQSQLCMPSVSCFLILNISPKSLHFFQRQGNAKIVTTAQMGQNLVYKLPIRSPKYVSLKFKLVNLP